MALSTTTKSLQWFARSVLILLALGELFNTWILVALYLKFGFTYLFWMMAYAVVIVGYILYGSFFPSPSKSKMPALVLAASALLVAALSSYFVS